jgi:hypothetical protein
MYDDLLLSTLIFVHCSSSLMVSSMIRVCQHKLNNVACSSQKLQLNAHQQAVFFQNITCIKFSDFSHGLSFNTITNALTKALQSVNYFQYLSCQIFYVVYKLNVLKL